MSGTEKGKLLGWLRAYRSGITEGVSIFIPERLKPKKGEWAAVRLEELDVDPRRKARVSDPLTAVVAARSNPGTKISQRVRIFRTHYFHYGKEPYGLNNYEGWLLTNQERKPGERPIINDSYTTRVSDLHKEPYLLLEDTGNKRLGANGIYEIVWRLTEKGLEVGEREFGELGEEVEML